jgi:hypothetical protein
MKKIFVIASIMISILLIGIVYVVLNFTSKENNSIISPSNQPLPPMSKKYVINLTESVGVKGGRP